MALSDNVLKSEKDRLKRLKDSGFKMDRLLPYLNVNGKYYVVDIKNGKPVFVKRDKGSVEHAKKLLDEVVSKLKGSLNPEIVIREAIKNLGLPELEKLHTLLFKSKVDYKPKTEEHCAIMKVGNYALPIVYDTD